MHQFALIPAVTALLLLLSEGTLAIPSPNTDNAGAAYLRRSLKARQTSDYSGPAPYKINADYLVWNIHGDGVLNKAFAAGYEAMKIDPPKPKYDFEPKGDDGIYAYDEDAMYNYAGVVGEGYYAVNDHAPTKDYAFDWKLAVKDSDYCVWWHEYKDDGCWFNQVYDYGVKLWGLEDDDPYKMKVKRAEKDWAVYATTPDLNYAYAEAVLLFYYNVNEYGGGLKWDYEWTEPPKRV